jgi:hypothetical protein
MDWVWIRNRLLLAEWHLDSAVSAAALPELMRVRLQHAQEAFSVAMAAVERVSLDGPQQQELDERLRVLSTRLRKLRRRSR